MEGIEKFVEIHDDVKRNLEDVRYVLKRERKLVSLGRLKAKGMFHRASSRTLKVIRGSMVLMRGRSESNLYMLQVSGGCLGHKVDDACK